MHAHGCWLSPKIGYQIGYLATSLIMHIGHIYNV